jgi:ABC-type sulfate/molybdate transport systems ATPase subunit
MSSGAAAIRPMLRQAGPAVTVATEPADPDVARLLGWTELGHGTASGGTAHIGQLALSDKAAGLHGPVRAFYRPEDVRLSHSTADTAAAASLSGQVERIVRTRPLARITLDCDPPITALMFHRDIDRLRLTAGNTVRINLPPGSFRIFQARTQR